VVENYVNYIHSRGDRDHLVGIDVSTILELICFHHNACFQFVYFLLYDLVCYVLEMRTLGIYMSVEAYVSNSNFFGLLCYLNVIFWGKHVFEKIWLFFSGGYIYGYPCYYEVMFWVHMFVEGHPSMRLYFGGFFLENFDFFSLCLSKSML
jgi:hypothetical protein